LEEEAMKRWMIVLVAAYAVVGCTPQPTRQTVNQPPVPPPAPATPATAPAPVSTPPEEKVDARVPSYTVSASLAEVVNLKSFTAAVPIAPLQRSLLQKNLFVCSPTDYTQLYHVYENNEYLKLPNFVTTDSILQLYHIFYDYTLRSAEADALLPALTRMTDGLLKDAVSTWQAEHDASVRSAALKNVAFFAVAARALGKTLTVPPEAATMLRAENALIAKHAGFTTGAIFPYAIDYSQFVPRGHYTRSPALRRYFTAMMWYGLVPFAPYRSDKALNEEQIRQGLLIARALDRTKLMPEWKRIYEPTVFYVGSADDQTPEQWMTAGEHAFGAGYSAASLADSARIKQFVDEIGKLPKPRIRPELALQPNVPDPLMQMRMMGQRYIPDSEVLQRLSKPLERPFPCGLDVMAVLGSDRAAAILDASPQIYNEKNWTGYIPERKKLTSEFAALSRDTWTSNLYYGWLHALRALLTPVAEGYPAFMRSDAWLDRSIHTALGSWAELRHDTILYGKQSVAECGDGEEPPRVRGYVEPNVIFYRRLLALTKKTHDGLARRHLLSDKLKTRFEDFQDLLAFLQRVSEKELRNETLKDEEYEQIRVIGGQMEQITLSIAEGSILSETDKNMAVVADVHTSIPKVLEEGVGHAYELLVIAPVAGKPTLTRGAVFSYFEFKHPQDDRLTDEKWQAILKAGKQPAAPPWTKSFLAPKGARQKQSKDLEVYGSGC
jgi:hypothetical protein